MKEQAEWIQFQAEAGIQLVAAGLSNGRTEARWLAEDIASEEEYRERIRRRLSGEPMQYIMGKAAFWDADLKVGPGVLIPRPETEELVELALTFLRPGDCVCDLCTGSGAIAIALARALPELQVFATELSPEALRYARENCAALAPSVQLFQGDLFAPLPADIQFSLILSNPPYVSPEEYGELSPVVREYEPRMALEAQHNGLQFYERIAEEGRQHLRKCGRILCEIGEEQGREVLEFFQRHGYAQLACHKDLFGKDRFVTCILECKKDADAK